MAYTPRVTQIISSVTTSTDCFSNTVRHCVANAMCVRKSVCALHGIHSTGYTDHQQCNNVDGLFQQYCPTLRCKRYVCKSKLYAHYMAYTPRVTQIISSQRRRIVSAILSDLSNAMCVSRCALHMIALLALVKRQTSH